MRRRSRTRRWVEIILLLAGLSGVGVWVWSNVRLNLYQYWANRKLQREVVARKPAAATPLLPKVEKGALIGRLVIPRIKLAAIVREGAGADTLDVALGHIPGTSFPGQQGNVGVAGHRDTLFRGLGRIAKDDSIQFQTPGGDYTYQVESTGIVQPQDVGVLGPGKHPEMTLVTCYPFHFVGPAPDRFIVKARLVTTPALATAAPPISPPVPRARPQPGRMAPSATRRVGFRLSERQSRELAPGILLGMSWTDFARHRANGWVWLARERRTVWLRNQPAYQPVLLGSGAAGGQNQLIITSVTRSAVTGYLLLSRGI